MNTRETAADVEALITLAAHHQLALRPETMQIIDFGLDYQVALAEDDEGRDWVLRAPRRDDVVASMHQEAAILDLVQDHLAAVNIAVPDWQIHSSSLIAYPQLPGTLAMTLVHGEPAWHIDPSCTDYATAFGALVARLHSIPVEQAVAAGVDARGPEDLRHYWRQDVEKVVAEFDVAEHLRRGWEDWINDDSLWPDSTVMTHGEIYPGHVLVGADGGITGVIDWTTARVDDPARDLVFAYALGDETSFEAALTAYQQAGGYIRPKLAEQCAQLWSAGAIGYGLYAIQSGDQQAWEQAQQQLNPENSAHQGISEHSEAAPSSQEATE